MQPMTIFGNKLGGASYRSLDFDAQSIEETIGAIGKGVQQGAEVAQGAASALMNVADGIGSAFHRNEDPKPKKKRKAGIPPEMLLFGAAVLILLLRK